ncbi:MAG: hypothetical protein KC417_16925, partial [Myxococcales bacterium]|nr:hypothetical protein [Myxococcales bacterium]
NRFLKLSFQWRFSGTRGGKLSYSRRVRENDGSKLSFRPPFPPSRPRLRNSRFSINLSEPSATTSSPPHPEYRESNLSFETGHSECSEPSIRFNTEHPECPKPSLRFISEHPECSERSPVFEAGHSDYSTASPSPSEEDRRNLREATNVIRGETTWEGVLFLMNDLFSIRVDEFTVPNTSLLRP